MATAVLTALVGLIPGLEELLVPASGPLTHKLHLAAFPRPAVDDINPAFPIIKNIP